MPVPARPAGQRVASATGIPAAIARTAAASRAGSVLPGAGRRDDESVRAGADGRVQQRAVHRHGRGDEVDPLRGTRRRHVPPAGAPPDQANARPVDPAERAAVRAARTYPCAEACILVTSSAGSIVPPRETTTPAPRIDAAAATRTASRRLAGPSKPASSDARIAPVTTTGFEPSRTRSQQKLVSSIVSVPWTTTAPSIDGSARAVPQVAGDVEQDREREVAGGRPAAVDRDDVGDRVQTGRPGEDGGAVEDRHVAAGRRVVGGADGPTGEHDRDARHRWRPSRGRSGRPGRCAPGPAAGPPGRRAPATRPGTPTGSSGGLAGINGFVATVSGRSLGLEGDGEGVGRARIDPAVPFRFRELATRRHRHEPGDHHADRHDEDDRGRADQLRDPPDDDDRQEAGDRDEHPEHAEHPAADVLGQVLLELRLGRDGDQAVGDAGEERDDDDDGQQRRRRRTGRGRPAASARWRSRLIGPAADSAARRMPERDETRPR